MYCVHCCSRFDFVFNLLRKKLLCEKVEIVWKHRTVELILTSLPVPADNVDASCTRVSMDKAVQNKEVEGAWKRIGKTAKISAVFDGSDGAYPNKTYSEWEQQKPPTIDDANWKRIKRELILCGNHNNTISDSVV